MIRNAVIYLGSSVVNKAAPFLLLPLFTHYLTPVEFGALSMFLVINGLFIAVIGMGIHTNISKHFFSSSKGELAELIGNMFFVLGCSTGIAFLVCVVVSLMVDKFFSLPTDIWLALPALSFLMMVNTINLTLLRNESRPYLYAIFEVANTFLSLVITVTLLVAFNFGWYSQVVGLFASNAVFSVVAILYILSRKYIQFQIRINVVKPILRLCLPLIPHVLGGVIIAVSDRLFIERMVGLEAVALYSIGYSFGMIVGLFTDAFIKAWTPWFFRVLQVPTERVKKDVVRFTYIYSIAVFLLAFVISAIAILLLPFIVGPPFLGASDYIGWVALGCAVHGVYKIFFPYLVHINKTSFLAVSTVVAALANIVLNYFFVSYFGAIGAAYSTILSYALSTVLVFCYQSHHFKMPWATLKL